MIQEGIEKVEQLVRSSQNAAITQSVTIDGQEYLHAVDMETFGRSLGKMLTPPRPATLSVTTLTGFVDAIRAGCAGPFDTTQTQPLGDRMVHVIDHLNVTVESLATDRYGVREEFLRAKYTPIDAFPFNTFMEPHKFIIALQVQFLPTDGDYLYLQRLASNLKAGSGVKTEDDGFTQTVTVAQGEVKSAEVTIKPRVKLAPYRTFPEATEVFSEFLVRFKTADSGAPMIALYDVDGNRWKGLCMQEVKNYLRKELPTTIAILA